METIYNTNKIYSVSCNRIFDYKSTCTIIFTWICIDFTTYETIMLQLAPRGFVLTNPKCDFYPMNKITIQAIKQS